MLLILINAIKIIFLLGLLVFIHEGGHFLVAKACKVRVNEFALGFGPIIWSKKGKETKYSIRLVPLGGFVNMLGEAERSEEKGSFSKTSIPKRMAIVFAGGIVNIAFGLIVYFVLVSSNGSFVSKTVSEVKDNYSAKESGILQNDEIIKINNKTIRLKSDIDKILQETEGQNIIVTIKRDNKIENIELTPTKVETRSIGIYLGKANENISSKIQSIYLDGPAEKAGVQEGDIVLSVDNENVNNDAYKLVSLITNSQSKSIKLSVQRNNEIIDFYIEPQITTQYFLGVVFKEAENNFKTNIYYGFWDTVDFSLSILDNLKELFSGNVSTDQLMGPVGISTVVAETDKIIDYIYLIALISLSLGVTNLLPFPPLDGGKIVILLVEAIRRKPIKENIEMGIQTVGFILMIGLSLYITYNDVLRIF